LGKKCYYARGTGNFWTNRVTTLASRFRIIAQSAIWTGVFWGILEGLSLLIAREFPAIRAAHKNPPSALWMAACVQTLLFLLASGPLAIVSHWFRGRFEPKHALTLFTMIGAMLFFSGPEVLDRLAYVMLALGAGTCVWRAFARTDRATMLFKRTWIPVLALVLLAGGTTSAGWLVRLWREASTPAASTANAPDVIVIVMDTIRRDRMDLNGDASLTPMLARRAAQGAIFANAWATSSWSLPSQATILTGRIPQQHGADWPHFRLSASVPTLAEVLRSRGYATGAFSSNDAWITPEYLGRGFNRFETYRLRDVWRRTGGGRIIGRLLRPFGWRPDRPSKPMQTTTEEFLRFAEDQTERPIFAYLCYMDVNRAYYDRMDRGKWDPPRTIESGVSAYESALTQLDTEIERVLLALEKRGRLANTIVAVTSDHGESFGEGVGDRLPGGHGSSLYTEQVRVPLAVIAPGRVPAGTKVARPVTLTDLAGYLTFLAVGGDPRLTGHDLLATPAPDAASELFLTLDYSKYSARSIVAGNLQYIWDRTKKTDKSEEVIDLVEDAGVPGGVAIEPRDLAAFRALVHRTDPAAGADALR